MNTPAHPSSAWPAAVLVGLLASAHAMAADDPFAALLSAQAGSSGTAAAEAEAPRKDLENDPAIYLQLIRNLQDKGMYFASIAHLDAFDLRWPNDPKAILLRADALRETGHLERAAALYEVLLKGPMAASARHGQGLIATKKGDLNAAESALTRASQINPTDAAILNDLGYVQILLRRLNDAGFNLHKATELDPKNLRAAANLALYYLLDGQAERAEGVMGWYKLSEQQRKEILARAAKLSDRVSP
ncbi:MAG: hypothetical protein PHS77_03850 [Gallionellaceae bacterium]|nr:hypothetical protein [Gallionellaceae bacterium]